jgi:hypothetical protein
MTYPSPRTPGSTPGHDWEYSRMGSATPTPSPRPTWQDQTPRRPATRASHTRVHSYSQQSSYSPRPPRESPRYNSSGEYATMDVSAKRSSSSRRPSGSFQRPPKGDRQYSYAYVRSSTPYGESDEDEIFEAMGHIYVLPAQSRSKGRKHSDIPQDFPGVRYTNPRPHAQGPQSYYQEAGIPRESIYEHPQHRPQPQQPYVRPPTAAGHVRRSSTAVPPRPSTVRPQPNPLRAKPKASRPATESDALRHQIPAGYSLKNWDPTEEPILLLGSVFDGNNLGKWIYDWTVYHEGPNAPISEMAGDLWLLLIQLTNKIKSAEQTVGRVRSVDNKEIISDFIDAGERLMDKLRSLLKACEAPMLKAARKKQSGLGKNAGVEFVDTLFGRERELAKTERFMQNVRLFNLRFDANCEDILRNPTM